MPPTSTGARRALSVRKTAYQLDLHYSTIYRLIKSGQLPAYRVGQQLRIDPDALDAFIASGGGDATTDTVTEPDAVDTWVDRMLATAPPLTDEQRTKLAELLKPVRRGGAA